MYKTLCGLKISFILSKGSASGKEPSGNPGDIRDKGSIPGSRRSPGGEHGNPLQYSWLESPMDRGAWQVTVHRVAKSQIWLKQLQFSCSGESDSLRPHGLQHSRPSCSSLVFRSLLKLVHWVGDAIQPSHPLLSLSPAFNLSQHQGLFRWVSSSHQVAKVLEFQLQHQSFQWALMTDLL